MGNVPKLRFKGFEEKWEKAKINEISHINPKVEKLDDKFYYIDLESVKKGSVNKMTEVEREVAPSRAQRALSKGDVLYQLVRPYQKNHFYFDMDLKKQVVASTGFAQIRVRSDVDGQFLTQLLLTDRINKEVTRRCTGTSYPAINSADFGEIKVYFPSKKEQLKISRFLFELEEKLKLQQEKIQLLKEQKKGYMQKLFNRELRFKNENGNLFADWKKYTLYDVVDRVVRKNKGLQSDKILTISAQNGLIDQTEYFNKTVASKNLEGYYLLKRNEFAYNKSYSNGYPLGVIKRLKRYEHGVLSSLYICFENNNKYCNTDFLEYYFESSMWHKEVAKISVEGARNHGLLNISIEDFFNTKHILPSLEEQEAIAAFFNILNEKLNFEMKKVKLLENEKRYFMQQMFI